MNFNEVGLSWRFLKPKLEPNRAHRICKVMRLHQVLISVLLRVCWKCIYWWRSNLTIGEQPLLWPCWQALAFLHLFEDFSNIVALGALPSTCVVLCLLCQKKEERQKTHISMVTERIKNASKQCKNARDVQTVASAGVRPGADRCTAYSVDE